MKTYSPDSMEKVVRQMHAEKYLTTNFHHGLIFLLLTFKNLFCSILKIKEEDEERKRRIEQRKAVLQGKHNRSVAQRWTRTWPVLRNMNIRSPTVRVVALSVSVATVAFIYNYVRPSLEIF